MRVLQENYTQPAQKVTRPGSQSKSRLNKENFNEPEERGRRSQNKSVWSNDKDLSITVMNGLRDNSTLDIFETIDKIQQSQDQYVKELNLKEAQESKEKMIELQREVVARKKRLLEDKHQEELDKIREAQTKEMSDFNEFWDQRVAQFEQEAAAIESKMICRHEDEYAKAIDGLHKIVPMKKKFSTQHLNYKRSLEALIKKKNFIEAERVKNLCDALEREEMTKAYHDKEKRVKFFLSQLDSKHKSEANVLRKRISSGRQELLKAKAVDLEKMLHKFQNTRQHHSLDHQHELYKFDSAHRSILGEKTERRGSKSTSRSMSRSNSRAGSIIQDCSKSRLSNISMISPLNLTVDRSSAFTTPVTSTKNHRRSQTNFGKDVNIIEISSLFDSTSSIKVRRASSVVKQVVN